MEGAINTQGRNGKPINRPGFQALLCINFKNRWSHGYCFVALWGPSGEAPQGQAAKTLDAARLLLECVIIIFFLSCLRFYQFHRDNLSITVCRWLTEPLSFALSFCFINQRVSESFFFFKSRDVSLCTPVWKSSVFCDSYKYDAVCLLRTQSLFLLFVQSD